MAPAATVASPPSPAAVPEGPAPEDAAPSAVTARAEADDAAEDRPRSAAEPVEPTRARPVGPAGAEPTGATNDRQVQPADDASARPVEPAGDMSIEPVPPAGGASGGAVQGHGGAAGAGGATAVGGEVRADRSTVGGPVGERAREALVVDDDLVDPDVADPDLVGSDLDGDTRVNLGLPPEPSAPARAPSAGADAEDGPADASEATVTMAAGALADRADAPRGDTAEPADDPAGAPAGAAAGPGGATGAGATTALPTWAAAPVGTPAPTDAGTTSLQTWAPDPDRSDAPTTAVPTWSPDADPRAASEAPTTAVPTWSADAEAPTAAAPTWSPDAGEAPTTAVPTWGSADAPADRRPAYGSFGTAAPEGEPATQMIAPLPFGSPAATADQPARAFRAQPPAGPPLGFQGERPAEDRRRRALAALLVAVGLVAAVVLGAVLLVNGMRGDGRDSGSGGGGDPGGATAAPGPAPVPPGYSRYEGAGFTVAVPRTWPSSTRSEGVVDVKDPGSSRFLRLITVESTTPALTQLTAAERQFAANRSYADYQRVRLTTVDYRGLDAADWEFTFTLNGVPRHVVYRGVVTGGRTYGLYLSTTQDQWATSRNVFQIAADTFRTG